MTTNPPAAAAAGPTIRFTVFRGRRWRRVWKLLEDAIRAFMLGQITEADLLAIETLRMIEQMHLRDLRWAEDCVVPSSQDGQDAKRGAP